MKFFVETDKGKEEVEHRRSAVKLHYQPLTNYGNRQRTIYQVKLRGTWETVWLTGEPQSLKPVVKPRWSSKALPVIVEGA